MDFRVPSGIRIALGILLAVSLAACSDDDPKNSVEESRLVAVQAWNQVAIDASGRDHAPGGGGEQLGPCRASRALAIVQIAVFEAVNAVAGGYESYAGLSGGPSRHQVVLAGLSPATSGDASMEAAVGQAAHDALVATFPSQQAIFDAELSERLADIADGPAETAGIDIGRAAALASLAMRVDDGSAHPEPIVDVDYLCGDQPGNWRKDPISLLPPAMGAHWYEVRPFVMTSSTQFRIPAPPALDSPEYATAYNEVRQLGGDGITTPTIRTPDQTETGIFWAYDGTPSLCAPPRLYNQILVQIAAQRGSDAVELARLLAIANVAMADAGIAIWESKYYYKFWRPVTGIRESDPGTGPTGTGDGNPATAGDVAFSPLGAPASNLSRVNFTPPFPSYPSGHAGFGGALFETLRRFYGTDDIAFTFVSDEYNGQTRDRDGNIRPRRPRSFQNLSQAEEENGQSRIYLGIHWSFDKVQGIAQGRQVADLVFDHLYRPISS